MCCRGGYVMCVDRDGYIVHIGRGGNTATKVYMVCIRKDMDVL